MFKSKPQVKPTITLTDAPEPEISARAVVEQILGRGIAWYNYRELDDAAQRQYYSAAQGILTNEVFKNELAHIIGDLVQHIAKKSKDWKEVEDLRMTINGIQLIVDRLESIENPDKNQSTEDVLSAI